MGIAVLSFICMYSIFILYVITIIKYITTVRCCIVFKHISLYGQVYSTFCYSAIGAKLYMYENVLFWL